MKQVEGQGVSYAAGLLEENPKWSTMQSYYQVFPELAGAQNKI